MNWGNSLMSNIDDIKKAFEDQRDIVDALFEELGEKENYTELEEPVYHGEALQKKL